MDLLFLIAYVAIPIATWVRSRSVTWTVITVGAAVALGGAGVNFAIDHITLLSRLGLQIMLLACLAVPLLLSLVRGPRPDVSLRRQVLGLGLPVALVGGFIAVVTLFWTATPAFLTPVAYLIGHGIAEDNAKWLDFTSLMATGSPIDQLVPMGGPLQLFLVFVATGAGVVSQIVFGGYNEVFVAANTVIFGEYLMVALAPLALAPLISARIRSSKGLGRQLIPLPVVWLSVVVLVAVTLMCTAYGHLTLQFTLITVTIWVTAFLAWRTQGRGLLLTSIAVVAASIVWLPLNVLAVGVLVAWIAVLVLAPVVNKTRRWDIPGLVLLAVTAVLMWQPLKSSLIVTLGVPTAHEAGGAGGAIRGVIAGVVGGVRSGLGDTGLFAAGGGTEQTTAILGILAIASAVGAAIVTSRQRRPASQYLRLLPVMALVLNALAIGVLDQWVTGSAPHYGTYKFTFMVATVLIVSCLPIAIMGFDSSSQGMTMVRWLAVIGVIALLAIDSLLIRSIAAARPQQWSPPIPFENPRSYWWPAEVNGTADQPIAKNPVACLYLPQGAPQPSALLDSQLSDAQRVYSCTRIIAALAGEDRGAQPMVDWLRREWTSNTRAWPDVYGYLRDMPEATKRKPVIILDDGSNVIGIESVASLLDRYPPVYQ